MYQNTKRNNYTSSINQSQISDVFKVFTKKDWIENLTNIESDFYVLIKDEVEELFYNTNGYLNYLDFESVYKLSIEMTIQQIKKKAIKIRTLFLKSI